MKPKKKDIIKHLKGDIKNYEKGIRINKKEIREDKELIKKLMRSK